MSCQITLDKTQSMFIVHTPYSAGFVAALKASIPQPDRKWDKQRRAWLVAPEHGQAMADLVQQHYGKSVDIPAVQAGATVKTALLNLRYLGRVKEREDGSATAFGWHQDGWNAIFPKQTLLEWFGLTERPDDIHSLYARIGARPNMPQADLKKAYRRAARQWHPDVSTEPDAHEQFQRIQHAWTILQDPVKRGKYDAGRALEATFHNQQTQSQDEWTPPLRCGFVLVNGRQQLGRMVVDEILQWEDILNPQGQTLVSSWPMGADMFQENWS